MTHSKPRFREQAVNRFIELILARLVDADRIKVNVTAQLKQLARGEVEAIAIQLLGFRPCSTLQVNELHLTITDVAVNMQSAMRRRIELLHPAYGSVQVVVSPLQLANYLTAALVTPSDANTDANTDVQVRHLTCEFELDGAIAITCAWQLHPATEPQVTTLRTIPQIDAEQNRIVVEIEPGVEQECPPGLATVIVAGLGHVLSLRDLANQGTTFSRHHLVIDSDLATVQAAAYIESVPSE